jgi:Xaa-Pro aminopeptidase
MSFSQSRTVASRAGLIVVLLVLATTNAALAAGISEQEFTRRRASIAAMLDSASVAVFRSADVKQRSADAEYKFRQESNLLYLTGVNEPVVTLVQLGRSLILDGSPTRRILLVRSEMLRTLTAAGVFKDGIIVDITRQQEILNLALAGAKTLYLSAPDIRFVNDWLNDRPLFVDRDVKRELERRYDGLKVKSAGPIVAKLREIKSESEIALIKESIAATGEGILRAMKVCRPGAYEYELQAAIEFEMTRRGAAYVGFPSIIGSGPNSLIVHYNKNRRQMRGGEVVVMDVGAEMEGYSADLTRSIPVSGKFTKEQRSVYNAVLGAQQAVIGIIRPGRTFADLDRTAKSSLEKLGFGRYLNHGVSHHLGLDTHDAGGLDTLKAGMVITVEPGAYIPVSDSILAPAYRGWGVRIEDDVLVTDTGATVLSSSIPKEIQEIERVMRK